VKFSVGSALGATKGGRAADSQNTGELQREEKKPKEGGIENL